MNDMTDKHTDCYCDAMDIVCELSKILLRNDSPIIFVINWTRWFTSNQSQKQWWLYNLFNDVFVNHGLNKILTTDRGIRFASLFWKSFAWFFFKTKLAMKNEDAWTPLILKKILYFSSMNWIDLFLLLFGQIHLDTTRYL